MLTLRSADPADAPVIDPRYLAEEADVAAMVSGVEIVRDLVSARTFDAWRGPEALPAPARGATPPCATSSAAPPAATSTRSAAARWASARTRSSTPSCASAASRACGSPTRRSWRTSANTNAATMVIGEKAADLVRAAMPAAPAVAAA